jgi:hypothetical protein
MKIAHNIYKIIAKSFKNTDDSQGQFISVNLK